MIGVECRNVARIKISVKAQVDAQLCQLSLIPADQVGDLAATRLQSGQPELSANLGPRLRQRHSVTAFRRHACGLEPRRTGHPQPCWLYARQRRFGSSGFCGVTGSAGIYG